jgi:hypothetical protein
MTSGNKKVCCTKGDILCTDGSCCTPPAKCVNGTCCPKERQCGSSGCCTNNCCENGTKCCSEIAKNLVCHNDTCLTPCGSGGSKIYCDESEICFVDHDSKGNHYIGCESPKGKCDWGNTTYDPPDIGESSICKTPDGYLIDCNNPKISGPYSRSESIPESTVKKCTAGDCYHKALQTGLNTITWDSEKSVCYGEFDCSALPGCETGKCWAYPGNPKSCCTGDYLGKVCANKDLICYPDGTCGKEAYNCVNYNCVMQKGGQYSTLADCQDHCKKCPTGKPGTICSGHGTCNPTTGICSCSSVNWGGNNCYTPMCRCGKQIVDECAPCEKGGEANCFSCTQNIFDKCGSSCACKCDGSRFSG